LFKQYSSVVRFAYNRFLENKSEKDIRLLTKELNNIELLNSWLTQCAIRDAKAIQERFQEQKVIFGGKYLFKQRLQNKISKEAFEIKRLSTLTSQGEMQYLGNRLFKLDIANQQIKFVINHRKRNKQNQQFILHLPHLRKSYRQQLLQLEELCKSGTLCTQAVLYQRPDNLLTGIIIR
jgi:predicted transposase